MERANGIFGGGAIDPVDGDGRKLVIIQGDDAQKILRQPHGLAAAAAPQRSGRSLTGQGDILAAQLRQPHDCNIDIGDFVPCGRPYNAIGGKIEDTLKCLYRPPRFVIEKISAGGADGRNGGIVDANAVEPCADRAHALSPAADGKRRAGIGGADAALHGSSIYNDVVSVIIAQNPQRGIAAIGKSNGAPLGKPRTGNGGAIAVLRKDGIHRTAATDIAVEQFIDQTADVGKDIASIDEILVVGGIIGDIKVVALAGIPFGKDTVLGEGDLRQNIGAQSSLGPCGINLTGGNVFNVIPKADGDIAGGGIIRGSQMHRDVLRHIDLRGCTGPRKSFDGTIGCIFLRQIACDRHGKDRSGRLWIVLFGRCVLRCGNAGGGRQNRNSHRLLRD